MQVPIFMFCVFLNPQFKLIDIWPAELLSNVIQFFGHGTLLM